MFSRIEFDERLFSGDFTLDASFIASASRDRVVVRDAASGVRLIYEGEGLKVANGEIVKGTIDDVSILTRAGKPLLEINNANVDVAPLGGGDTITFFGNFTTELVLKPNKFIGSQLGDSMSGGGGLDIMRGRQGNDFIDGGEGNDVLSGGGGSDTFQFADGMDRDTIMDFDAAGGAGFQDLIGAGFDEVASISQQGRNTVIAFDGGEQFVLRGIDAATIDETDFRAEF